MNIQINLIRPSEQRSANVVSLKSLGFIAAIIGPLVVLLCLAWAYMGYLEVRSALKLLEEERLQSERPQKEAKALKKNLDIQQGLYNEVMGWSRSRLPWNEVLDEMKAPVPEAMQWRSLQMHQQLLIDKDGQLTREHVISLIGFCRGPNADVRVEALRRAWAAEAPMTQWIAQAQVTSYKEDDSPNAGKDDRLFQIEAKCHPRRFHAPAGK